MAGLFHVCQGTCLCASSSGEGYGKGKVLYCYGEVVLQRTSLRSGSEEEQADQEEVYTIQIVQLASLVVLLLAVLLVLLTIKQGLSKIQKQIKKIMLLMPPLSPPSSRPNTLEKKQGTAPTNNGLPKKAAATTATPNGNCLQQLPRDDIITYRDKDPFYSRLDRDRDSIRFEKEEVRSLNNHFHLHDKIERIDSYADSVGEVS